MDITQHPVSINREGSAPIWMQIKKILLECLTKEILMPGQIIPNEQALVDWFKVSLGTVRKAVGSLEEDGILIRRQGIGTFVASHDSSSFLYKYFHILPKGSDTKVLPNIDLISFKKRSASDDEQGTLKIHSKDKQVFHIRNKISVNNKPCMIDDIIIDCTRFPLLNKDIFSNRSNTIYNLYQNRFGVFITAISERIKAVTVPKSISLHLDIKNTQPVMKITRIGYSYNQVPVELRVSYLYTKNVEYRSAKDIGITTSTP